MAKKYRITLEETEQARLSKILETRSSNSPQVKRSYILLAADENGSKKWIDEQIHQVYNVGIRTIERLRQRFVEEGLETALNGKPRKVFKERVLDGRVESHLVVLRCSDPPEGHNQWSLRLLADKMVELNHVEAISHESVRQILKKTKLSRGRSSRG
jgi:transposase